MEDAVDELGDVVAALFDVLVERREVGGREPADGLVVVHAEDRDAVRDAEVAAAATPPSLCWQASVMW